MTVYAVGDIQGCYDPLRALLDRIGFEPGEDKLWVAGDMVNRGPDSLATLRFLKSLGKDCIAILGNHDLHLIAIAANICRAKKRDTLMPVLKAPDSEELIAWLRHRPFLHHDPTFQTTMVHAGIPPIWTLKQALHYAGQLEKALQSDDYVAFLRFLFKSDKNTSIAKALTPRARLKMTVNYFTRMRFCNASGQLDLDNKTNKAKKKFAPWYDFPNSPMYHDKIIFGHWAALEGKTPRNNIIGLDTGCVWGRNLTAINLKTDERTSVDCCC